MRSNLCLAVLLTYPLFGLLSQIPDDLGWVSPREIEILQKDGFFQYSAASLGELPLLKRHPAKTSIVSLANHQGRRQFNVLVEGLFWLPTRGLSAQQSLERFFILSQSFSKMKGMTYFSQSRGQREILILDISRVSETTRRDRLEDRKWSAVPDQAFEYFFQKDNTFGDGVYSMRVINSSLQSTIVITNEQQIFWGIVPLVDPQNLYFIFRAEFFDTGILVYGFSGAQTYSLFGLERSRESSFFNRLRALADWFRQHF